MEANEMYVIQRTALKIHEQLKKKTWILENCNNN